MAETTQSKIPLELPFPAIWLRDNCPCSLCRDPISNQKYFQITDLGGDVQIADMRQSEDFLEVRFTPDGHRSVFLVSWLKAQCCASEGDGRTEEGKHLWRAVDLAGHFPETDWELYRRDDRERLRVLGEVARLGFAVVRAAPRLEGTVLEVARTFGYVRETNYGELFDVRVELSAKNLAYTSLAIGPHTDNPYRDPVPTMQLLHCVSNAVEGGESGLVDGFMAASLLRSERPAEFQMLTRTLVQFAWKDESASLSAERPLIEVDPAGRVRSVRFNNRSMQALRLGEKVLVRFYGAYRAFAEVIARPDLQLSFRLEPGDCLMFDNTRLLHARSSFAERGGGVRHLQGCYADLDGLMSTIAVLAAAS
jgi:gamma-butyrobetaine dioxygenase